MTVGLGGYGQSRCGENREVFCSSEMKESEEDELGTFMEEALCPLDDRQACIFARLATPCRQTPRVNTTRKEHPLTHSSPLEKSRG